MFIIYSDFVRVMNNEFIENFIIYLFKKSHSKKVDRKTLLWHQQIDVLNHVQEELVPAVLDALTTPADLSGHLTGDLCLLLFGLNISKMCV